MATDLVIRQARVAGRLSDLRCGEGRILEVESALAHRAGEEEIDAAGGEVICGLVDHHIHLRSLAAAGSSVMVGPPAVADPERLAAMLAVAGSRLAPGEWIRAVGYHESVAGPLDASSLDALVADRPVRLQHRSGSLWMLNSMALALLDVAACRQAGVERDDAGRPTGRLWRMDGWLGQRVGHRPSDLGSISRMAGAAGVTGFTDATPGRSQADIDDLVAASAEGVIAQRLCLMTSPGVGLRSPVGSAGLVELGPVKVLLDDTTLPTLDELVARIGQARTDGRAVAVHCVTRLQLVVTLAALDIVGSRPGDRIEHGALISEEQFASLRALQLVVVTQPGLVATRGDHYAREVEAQDRTDLWRLGSLCRAGVAVALGTDAPFGSADPWVTLQAAQDRITTAGLVLGPSERIERAEALRCMAGPPGRAGHPAGLTPGEPADLCVLQGSQVTHTVVAGNLIFRV